MPTVTPTQPNPTTLQLTEEWVYGTLYHWYSAVQCTVIHCLFSKVNFIFHRLSDYQEIFIPRKKIVGIPSSLDQQCVGNLGYSEYSIEQKSNNQRSNQTKKSIQQCTQPSKQQCPIDLNVNGSDCGQLMSCLQGRAPLPYMAFHRPH